MGNMMKTVRVCAYLAHWGVTSCWGWVCVLQSRVWRGWSPGTLIYAGSMQYVTIDLSRRRIILAALMTLMVNARHLFYGISMLQRYKSTGADFCPHWN